MLLLWLFRGCFVVIMAVVVVVFTAVVINVLYVYLQQIDVGQVVSERLSALRKLQSNPNDVQALGSVFKAQQQVCDPVQPTRTT